MVNGLPPPAAALGRLAPRARLALSALCGAGLALVQAPVGFFPAFLILLPVLLWFVALAGTPARAALTGWIAGTAYFAVGLFWIVEPFLVDARVHGWMAPFALVFLAAGLALFWGAAFGLARWLAPRGGLALAWAVAVSHTGFEAARAYLLTGFPWNLIAYGWLDTPIAQVSALVGPHGLGFLTILAAGLVAFGWRGVPVALAAGAALSAWIWGDARMPETAPGREEPLTVRLVQPNAAQHLKWDPEWWPVFLERSVQYTAAPGAPDVIIWPETSLPFLMNDPTLDLAPLSRVAQGAPVIFGARRREPVPGWVDWYNMLVVLGDGGVVEATYDKHHLVPFGEFMPFSRFFARLDIQGIASESTGDYQPGPGPRVVDAAGLPPFVPLICYEAIFPHEVRPAGPRAEWLVHITNDAWFGALVGPYQHLAQSRFRAIEQGLPVARAANTGVSAIIDPWGRIVDEIPLGQEGFADIALPAPAADTPYGRSGDRPLPFLLVTILAGLVLLRRKA
ncbi:MAG: apolipoprotein N-acyltransferase [Rubricella sp.]